MGRGCAGQDRAAAHRVAITPGWGVGANKLNCNKYTKVGRGAGWARAEPQPLRGAAAPLGKPHPGRLPHLSGPSALPSLPPSYLTNKY